MAGANNHAFPSIKESAMSFAVIDETTSTPRMDAAWLDAHWMPFTGNRNFKA